MNCDNVVSSGRFFLHVTNLAGMVETLSRKDQGASTVMAAFVH